MLMRKTIKNRCEYLNRAGSRPRKYETHVGMYWSVQNKGFFLSQERAKKILWRQLAMDVHVNILAFLLVFVTLQSPQPDENQYPL